MADVSDLTHRLLREMRDEARSARNETIESLRHVSEQMKLAERLQETRMLQMQSELELLIKMELGGRLTHLETRLEQKIDDRMDEIAKEQAR